MGSFLKTEAFGKTSANAVFIRHAKTVKAIRIRSSLEPQRTHSLSRSLTHLRTQPRETCENCGAALSAETPRNRISSRRKPTQKRGAITSCLRELDGAPDKLDNKLHGLLHRHHKRALSAGLAALVKCPGCPYRPASEVLAVAVLGRSVAVCPAVFLLLFSSFFLGHHLCQQVGGNTKTS